MPTPLTALARLSLLLPWINGEWDEELFDEIDETRPEPVALRTDYAAIRRVLADFVKSFDGSAEATYIVAEPNDTPETLDDEAIGYLESQLNHLLRQGFDESRGRPVTERITTVTGEPVRGLERLPAMSVHDLALPLTSLRFAVRSKNRQEPKPKFKGARAARAIEGGAKAVRNYRAAGAYMLRVQGAVQELVPFLVAHLLMAPNMVTVRRCLRPTCGNFIVTSTNKRGPRRRFCARWCWELNREQVQQVERRKIRKSKQEAWR